jgi:hypothetical protein
MAICGQVLAQRVWLVSQPAILRVSEAVSEIKRAAWRDPVLGAEGAVLFLEKVSVKQV